MPAKLSTTDYDTAWAHPYALPRLQFLWLPTSTTGSSAVGSAWTTAGTASTPAQGSSSVWDATKRQRLTTTVASGQSASGRTGAIVMQGSHSALPGFRVAARFGFNSQVAGHRCFIGLQNGTGAIGNVEPDTLASIIAVIARSSDTNLQICHRRAGTAEYVNLGANFPVGLVNVPLELVIATAPNGSTFEWALRRIDTGASQSGTATGAQIPGQNTTLAFHIWGNTAANTVNAAAVELAWVLAHDY